MCYIDVKMRKVIMQNASTPLAGEENILANSNRGQFRAQVAQTATVPGPVTKTQFKFETRRVRVSGIEGMMSNRNLFDEKREEQKNTRIL